MPQSFILDNKDDFVILKSKDAYDKVISINSIVETIISSTGTIKKEFRWSIDGGTFSQWIILTLQNLQDLINYSKDVKFWIEYKYTLLTAGHFEISSTALNVTLFDDRMNNFVPLPIAFSVEKGNGYHPLNIKPFSFNPYKNNNKPALRLQKDLSFIVQNMYGHDVTYFRAVPDIRSRDVILGEWTLYNVSDPVCAKILIPNNEIPDGKFMFEMMGIEFESPLEVHIDKRYFEYLFGEGTMPQKRDIIHIPLTNRMMEVNSSQPVYDFMDEILYFKLDLKKYQKKSHVLQSDSVQELIDSVTTGVEELFNEEIQQQVEKITAEQHTKDKTTVHDPTREYLNPNLYIETENWDNNYTTISEFHYNFSKSYLKEEKYSTAVRYKNQKPWTINDDRSYTAWFKDIKLDVISKKITTVSIVDNVVTIDFMYAIPKLKVGQWMEIIDTADSTFSLIGEIEYVNYDPSRLRVRMVISEFLKIKTNRDFPNWLTSTTLVGKQTPRRNFISGYDVNEQKGMVIDSFDGKWFRIILNDIEYWIPISIELGYDKFYGLVVNISNKFNQLSLYIYETIPNSKSSNLNCIFRNVINNVESVDRSTTTKYEVKNSMLSVTNIRILTETIEEEKQHLWLNQNIIRDGDLAIVVDNAIPRTRIPYMGASK